MNRALLGKQAWRILTNPNSLVAASILPKYCKKKSFMDVQPRNDSWIWKSILIGRNVCSIGIDIQVWGGHQTYIVNGSIRKIDKGCEGRTYMINDLICPITHTWNSKQMDHIQDQVFKQRILEKSFSVLGGKDKIV